MGKKQHYVPQFYLRNFSLDKTGVDLFILKDKKLIESAPIKSVAYRQNLYGKDDGIEKMLSINEAEWSRIINLIIDNPEYIFTTGEYLTLLLFVLMSESRSAKTADISDSIIDFLGKTYLKLNNPDGTINGHEIDKFHIRQNIPNLTSLYGSLKVTPLISDLKYACIINESGIGFLTSDNPTIRYNQLYTARDYSNDYGYVNAGIQIFLPLSKYICICLYDSLVYSIPNITDTRVIKLSSKKQIKKINTLIAMNGYEYLFSNGLDKNYIEKLSEDNINKSEKYTQKEYWNGLNQIIVTSVPMIHKKINLTFFKINQLYLTCRLPNHMGGLTRPSAIPILDHIDPDWDKNNFVHNETKEILGELKNV